MTLQLISISGTVIPGSIRIAGDLDIGRDPHCDVRLSDESCSRFHAHITNDAGKIIISDNQSSNGTYVNDKKISAATLRHNDEVRCGDCAFVVIDNQADARDTRIVSDSGSTVGLSHSIDTRIWQSGDDPRQLALIHHVCRELAAAEQEQRPQIVLEAVKTICHPDQYALMTRGCILAGNMGERLALRLGCGSDARLFELGKDLHGQTIADEAIGSACSAPLGDDAWILVARSVDQDAFTHQHLSLLAQLSAEAQVFFPAASENLNQLIVGDSQPMRELRQRIQRLAHSDSTILITGASGTGKELVAQSLHRLSGRHLAPFVAVNCGAIADHLFEAELFGHVKGAFTGATQDRHGRFQAADGGTLFLDEIGELSLEMQVKLLRALQEKTVCPVGSNIETAVQLRVIAATNRDLLAEVRAGRFREDLFYRIDVLRLHTPPLSDRPDDIPLLARALLQRLCAEAGRPVPQLDTSAAEALKSAAWPGNVRQLENIMQRALVLADERIGAAELDLDTAPETEAADDHFPSLAELEARHIRTALERCEGNKSQAARLLGISRPTIHKKIGDYGLEEAD